AAVLPTTPAWIAESNQVNAYFGYSVSTAGDVNGDGFSDVLVAAINFQNGQFEEGRVFCYLGSATGTDTIPDWTAEGDQGIARLGSSVAPAGDVNGDGYADVVVAAVTYDSGESNEGRAYVYLGSAGGLDATPAWVREGDAASA